LYERDGGIVEERRRAVCPSAPHPRDRSVAARMEAEGSRRLRHAEQRRCQRRCGHRGYIGDTLKKWRFADGSSEILIQRVKAIGFELAENAAELLFDPVDGVGESCAIDFHLPAAEFLVRAEQEMIAEHVMLKIGQGATADQAKIGDIILIFSYPGQLAVFSGT